MALDFNQYAAKGNEILASLDRELGDQGREHAGRVLRAVLHALRNRISAEESLQFIAQLPMALKGLYVDGWKMATLHKSVRTLDDLADEIIAEGGRTAWRDFASKADAMLALRSVMKVLSKFISAGEFKDIAAIMPEQLRQEVRTWGDLKSAQAVQP
ncbi:MAG: DUF2267 domain-containing protein [Cyclobacteriaceae bacterium]|jgi:uncharacterized protein (DUF2267 family)